MMIASRKLLRLWSAFWANMYDFLRSLRPRCYDGLVQFGSPMYMLEFDWLLPYVCAHYCTPRKERSIGREMY